MKRSSVNRFEQKYDSMAQSSLTDFVGCLEKSRLLTDQQLQSIRTQLEQIANPVQPEALAELLVSQQHLTRWQADQLLKGQTGLVLCQYHLLNPIGRGGMGHVFRARDSQSGQIVAIKVMARKLTSNQTLVSRFRREIKASARLDSPYIVKSMDAGRVGKTDFLVMEYVNGEQVDRIANQISRFPIGVACEIIRQVAVGLQHAHECQMVHRDIKPANLMIDWADDGTGIIKLMDMGLVRLTSEQDQETVTKAGQVMGTPDYMSPEQGWDTTSVDIRSDIYSLGCTLFRLLTGDVPFRGTNPLQVLSQRLQRDAPSVLTIRGDVPEDIAAVVSRMTARDPASRFQTPAELVKAITPHCQALTREVLRQAAKSSRAVPDPAAETQVGQADQFDGTYEKFLQEVQEGATVDLMVDVSTFDGVSNATLPVLETDGSAVSGVNARPARRKRMKRGQKAGFVLMAVSVIVLAAVYMAVTSRNPRATNRLTAPIQNPFNDARPVTESEAVKVKASFADVAAVTAVAGEAFSYQPTPVFSQEPAEGEGRLQYRLSSTTQELVTIDQQSGEVDWQIPRSMPAGTYTVGVQLLHVTDAASTQIAELKLPVKVVQGLASVQLQELLPQRLLPGRRFELKAQTNLDAQTFDDLKLQYQLQGDVPSGLTIDPVSGELQWTPELEQAGQYEVTVAVTAEGQDSPADDGLLQLFVAAPMITIRLPDLPEQTATAGQPFQFDLGLADRNRLRRLVAVKPGPGAPEGVTIDDRDSILRWNVPADASGKVQIPLTAEVVAAGVRLSPASRPQTNLVVNVVASSKPNALPERDAVEKALAEHRETYRQAMASARSISQRSELAARLLSQAFQLPRGASAVALLELVDELAGRSRAYELMFETARERARSYGVDELAAAGNLLKSFRRAGLSDYQRDAILEHCVRLSRRAVDADQPGLAGQLLDVGQQVLRGPDGGKSTIAGDLKHAGELCASLTADSDSAAATLKKNELTRILDRWSFVDEFRNPDVLQFVQAVSQGSSAPNGGRNLWSFDNGEIRLTSSIQNAVVGVVLPAQQPAAFIFRFRLLADSTATQLLLTNGDPGSPDFQAARISLSPADPGRVVNLRTNAVLAQPTTPTAGVLYSDRDNHVELQVDGGQMLLMVNGIQILQTTLPEMGTGRLGLAADLRQADVRVGIRDPRILVLPAN
jgi:serine/threonine protein kinase